MSVVLEIDSDSRNSNSKTSDDVNREQEKWLVNHDTFFKTIMKDCQAVGARHLKISDRNKVIFNVISIPIILLPISVSVFNKFFILEDDFLRITLLLSLSVLSGLQSYFNFGRKQQLHFDYSHKYAELGLAIEAELLKKKKYRFNVDVFVESIKLRYLNLNRSSPIF
jgi:hypothetical protein